jgi:hypothetical protein
VSNPRRTILDCLPDAPLRPVHSGRTIREMCPVIRWSVACALFAAAMSAAACGSSGTSNVTPTADTSGTPRVTPAPVSATQLAATEVAGSLITRLSGALLIPSDVPSNYGLLLNRAQLVDQTGLPGLDGSASAALVLLARSDTNDFVKQIAVAPPDRATLAKLLDAVTPANYLSGLVRDASDGTATPQTLPGAPAGAKALSFSGTVSPGSHVTGTLVAFTHGPVFVVIAAGTYGNSAPAVDLVSIASAIDTRLAATPEAN